MDDSDLSDGRSSSSLDETVDSSWHKQLSILNEVEMQVKAIQSLIGDGGDSNEEKDLLQPQSPIDNQNIECGFFSTLSDMSHRLEKIYQVVTEGKNSIPSSLILSQSMTNHDTAIDVSNAYEEALNNSVVLRTIMKHLNAGDLLNCRFVTKSWKDEATIQLLLNQRNKVEFEWDEEKLKFQNNTGTLEEFTNSCYGDPSKKFPCSRFHFENLTTVDGTEEAPPDLSNFLSKYGHNIKNLTLEWDTSSYPEIVRKIIFDWTPHIKFLTLIFPCRIEDNEAVFKSDDGLQASTSFLQDLQELELVTSSIPDIVLENCKPLLSLILSSAPNLKRISDQDLSFLPEIMSSGKTRAVERINVHETSVMNPKFAEFTRARPQLTYLHLDLHRFLRQKTISISQLASSLLLILESSRMTLKKLHLVGRLHFDFNMGFEHEEVVQMNIPVMERLEKLKLLGWSSFENEEGRILPTGVSLQNVFPRLKTLSLHGVRNKGDEESDDDTDEEESDDSPFASIANSSTTVEKLTINPRRNSLCHPEWLHHAHILYPNVRTLKLIIYWSELSCVCSVLWKSWNKSLLEELKITLVPGCDDDFDWGDFTQSMDEALTGLDDKTCRMLRKRRVIENCQGEEFERGSSILDMSKLKLFELENVEDLPDDTDIFSRVSVIHAFDLMRNRQNLRVVIGGVDLEDLVIQTQDRCVDFGAVCYP